MTSDMDEGAVGAVLSAPAIGGGAPIGACIPTGGASNWAVRRDASAGACDAARSSVCARELERDRAALAVAGGVGTST